MKIPRKISVLLTVCTAAAFCLAGPVSAAPAEAPVSRYVALGDSYASGLGAGAYALYPPQNKTRQIHKLRFGKVREAMKAAKAAFMSSNVSKTMFFRFALAWPQTCSMGLWSGA